MTFSANFYARIFGAFALAYAGYSFGRANSGAPPTDTQVWATSLLMLCGVALGLIITPYLTVAPMQRLLAVIRMTSSAELFAIGFGMILGLMAAVLATVPLSRLPGFLGQLSPVVAAMVLGYIGAMGARARKQEISSLFRKVSGGRIEADARSILVDTSVIVDGRVREVVDTGFLDGKLLIPRFVLQELQHLADSSQDLTRAKGKRGLDVVRALQENKRVDVVIAPVEARADREVDDKLVALALEQSVPLLTNDTNLQSVAELQGVRVLNLNQLAEALRLPFAVGDRVNVVVRSEGREREQGVGFSADGTMIVVEDTRRLIGHEVAAVVTRVYTTQSGRIIFAQIDRANGKEGANRARG